jgi:hypothetical protein
MDNATNATTTNAASDKMVVMLPLINLFMS